MNKATKIKHLAKIICEQLEYDGPKIDHNARKKIYQKADSLVGEVSFDTFMSELGMLCRTLTDDYEQAKRGETDMEPDLVDWINNYLPFLVERFNDLVNRDEKGYSSYYQSLLRSMDDTDIQMMAPLAREAMNTSKHQRYVDKTLNKYSNYQ